MAPHSDDQNGKGHDDRHVHDETVTEPTIKVPVPAPGWIVIVAGTATRAAAAELPRAAFRDPALTKLLNMLDSEMDNADR